MVHLPIAARSSLLNNHAFYSRPEGPVLPAQAEGLGTEVNRKMSALKGPFIDAKTKSNEPFRLENDF